MGFVWGSGSRVRVSTKNGGNTQWVQIQTIIITPLMVHLSAAAHHIIHCGISVLLWRCIAGYANELIALLTANASSLGRRRKALL